MAPAGAGLGSSPAGRWGPEAGVGTGQPGPTIPPWDRTGDPKPQARPDHTRRAPEQSVSFPDEEYGASAGRRKQRPEQRGARPPERESDPQRPLPGTGACGPVPRPVSTGEAVLGEGDLSPGTRVLIARGPPGHRTPCEGRGGEGRDAATHQGAPKVTEPQEEPPQSLQRGPGPAHTRRWRENSPGLSQATPRVALPYSSRRRPMHAPPGSRNSRVQSPSGAQGGRSEASCVSSGRVFH